MMRRICAIAIAAVTLPFSGTVAGQGSSAQPYKILRTASVGGAGGFDYVFADTEARRLYVPRTGPAPRISVFDLDTLAPAGEIPNVTAHGVAVDSKSHHGFASSKPVVMWDTATLTPIKTIEVQGNPDGILFDPFNERVYVLGHNAPNATVIDGKDGSVVGTIDLDGAPEQAVTDGTGHIYVDVEDKANVAVVDAATMKVTAHYEFDGKAQVPAGLALDAKNHILFAACRNPALMVILDAHGGKLLSTLPIGTGVDGAVFNPRTMETFSSQSDGTLTVIKRRGPAEFAVEQTVKTMPSAKTLTLDAKTGRILLIAAEFGPAPEPGAGGRPARGPMVPDSFTILVVGR